KHALALGEQPRHHRRLRPRMRAQSRFAHSVGVGREQRTPRLVGQRVTRPFLVVRGLDEPHTPSIWCARLSRPAAYAALFAGLLLVPPGGPFIVLARVDAYAVVLLRPAGAAVVFAIVAAARGRLRIAPEHRARTALGALLLCAHFLLWIKAFDLTNYASNLLLLVSQPITSALLGGALGEHPTRDTWI